MSTELAVLCCPLRRSPWAVLRRYLLCLLGFLAAAHSPLYAGEANSLSPFIDDFSNVYERNDNVLHIASPKSKVPRFVGVPGACNWQSAAQSAVLDIAVDTDGSPFESLTRETAQTLLAQWIIIRPHSPNSVPERIPTKAIEPLKHLSQLTGVVVRGGLKVDAKGWKLICQLRGITCLNVGQSFREMEEGPLNDLTNLTSLVELDIPLVEGVPQAVSKLEGLEKLKLRSGIQLESRHLVYLSRLSGLSHLDISRTGVTDEGLGVVSEFFNLEALSLRGERGLSESAVCELRSQQALRILDIGFMPQVGSYFVHNALDKMPIEVLYWDSDGVSRVYHPADEQTVHVDYALDYTALRAIGELHTLKVLSLRGQQGVTAEGVAGLRGLEQLEALDLSGCSRVEAEFQEVLADLEMLRYLDLGLAIGGPLFTTNLEGPSLTSEGVRGHLAKTSVTHLYLRGRSGLGVDTLMALGECISIEELHLHGVITLDDATLRHIVKGASKLRVVGISGTLVTQEEIARLVRANESLKILR